MNIIFLLTIYGLPYLVNAKPVRKTIEENAEATTASKEEECERNLACSKVDIKNIRKMRRTDKNATQTNVAEFRLPGKSEVVLVKKPIPKFTDTGSDEDYQTKMRNPSKLSDTVEHEDEDFSVDDYEFDVSHDEFAGRGKPLEPRAKTKVIRQRKPTSAKVEQPRPVPTLSQNKVVLPHNENKPSIKVARHATAAGVMKEEEYDEEFSAVTTSPENQTITANFREKDISASSVSEEAEESRQEEAMRQVRATRTSSPFNFGTYVDKLEEKTFAFVPRMLTHLPLFPQKYVP